MSTLRILDQTGDTQVGWMVEDETSVEQANKLFTDMVKAGYLAYAISGESGGHKTPKKIIYDFDKQAEEIVMTPMLRGG